MLKKIIKNIFYILAVLWIGQIPISVKSQTPSTVGKLITETVKNQTITLLTWSQTMLLENLSEKKEPPLAQKSTLFHY